jgi:hypothetical protein
MSLFDTVDVLPETPSLELAFEVRLRFHPLPRLRNLPHGSDKGMVVVDAGEFRGPDLNGIVLPASGGDYASFRADGVVQLDARYMLQENDGTPIMLHNRGFLWGRSPDVMPRFSRIANGLSDEKVTPAEYYFRTCATFDVPQGPHDWLGKHIFVGVGARLPDGNIVRYYKTL